MVFKNRIFLLTLSLILCASTAFAVGYKKKFNSETGRGDWVIDETTLPGGSSSTIPYSSITAPTRNHGIPFSSYTNTWTSSVGNAT